MKLFTLLLAVGISFSAYSQPAAFPQSWTGNWKGDLEWFKTGKPGMQKINMELRIQPTDSTHKFTWQIIYGSAGKDNRPYTLIAKDTAAGHWVIDENNGVLLDQFWVANKFTGAFTVMNNTIINSYQVENNKLVVEFYSISTQPITTTGKGTEDSPVVTSYRMGSYQKAVLTREH